MRISELILELQAKAKIHGDVPVQVICQDQMEVATVVKFVPDYVCQRDERYNDPAHVEIR